MRLQSGTKRALYVIFTLFLIIAVFWIVVADRPDAWSGWAGSVVGTVVGGVLAVLVFLYQSRQQNDDERNARLSETQRQYRQNVRARAIRVANEVHRTMWAVDDRQMINLQNALWTPGLADQAIAALDKRLSDAIDRYYDALNEFRLLLPADQRADEPTTRFLAWFHYYETSASEWVDTLEKNGIIAVGALIALRQQRQYLDNVENHLHESRQQSNRELVEDAISPLRSSWQSAPDSGALDEIRRLLPEQA